MLYEKDFEVIQGYECLSSCISNYLSLSGIHITGSDILFIGGGFRVSYTKKSLELGTDIYLSNFRFMDNMDVSYEHAKLDPHIDPLDFLKYNIMNEKKICLKVGSEYLKYNRVFNQSGNSPHYINILGIKDDQVYICDGYVPTRIPSVFKGWVDISMVVNAWKSMCYEYILMIKINQMNEELLTNIAFEKVKQSIIAYLAGGIVDIHFLGHNAILQLNEELDELFKLSDMRDVTKKINYQLRIYGFISVKIILYEKLKQLYGSSINLDYYANIIDQWNKICSILLKSGYTNKRDDYKKVYEKITECTNKENEVLFSILKDLY